MLGRNGNIAYVRYDHQGRIVPGGPILQAKPPKVGNWQAVSNVTGNNWVGPSGTTVLRAFVRIDAFNRVVPSSLLLLNKKPEWVNDNTTWLEINAQYRGNGISTTTTTSTTTTFSPINFNITLTCNGTINTFSGNTPTGGSGTYEFTAGWYATEQDALNATSWLPASVSALYTGANNGTYWIACRDVNNYSNIIAKSVVANCQVTTTTTTTAPSNVAYGYNISNFYCDNCGYFGSNITINSEPLTIGKYYSQAEIYNLGVFRVDSFYQYYQPQQAFTHVTNASGKDTCAEVGCPS